MSDSIIHSRFEGAILAGAIGDAWGSSYEYEVVQDQAKTWYWGGKPKERERHWVLTDDTQLTLATCEAMCDSRAFSPALLADHFVRYYREGKLTGPGSSTLKAIIELQAGGHWSQVGRMGEYAAGNGAAMRIAPLAFFGHITRDDVRDVCRITHRNDEAYTGALAVFLSIRAIIDRQWHGNNSLFELIIPELPDTNVRDRLIKIAEVANGQSIATVAQLGTSGYVADSVPFALFAASKAQELGLQSMFEQIISAGGDTDTNASIAGQVAGALLGLQALPPLLMDRFQKMKDFDWLTGIVAATKRHLRF